MEEFCGWIDDAIEKIQKKMDWCSEKNRDKIPYTTGPDGSYDDRSDHTRDWRQDDGLNWWTNGFWGGIMWLMYQATGEEKYREIAVISEYRMEQCLEDFYGLHHDVGFMFQPTAVADYRLTGSRRSRKTALHAANLLAGRFNPAGRFIRSWNDLETDTRGWVIIDSMMNLSLLYWASEETKDPRFEQIARLHADTVMRHFIRPDGSVKHIVEFDPQSGKMVRDYGGQGYAAGSSWSRGQGWAVYGFTLSYIHTGVCAYLDTARKVARYCLDNLNESGIVPIDFRQPAEPALEDSCGACVIASGLIELAKYVPETESTEYRSGALKILKTLMERKTDFSRNCDAILQGCSGSYHNKDQDITMVYGDYYFIEAVYKLKETGILLW